MRIFNWLECSLHLVSKPKESLDNLGVIHKLLKEALYRNKLLIKYKLGLTHTIPLILFTLVWRLMLE